MIVNVPTYGITNVRASQDGEHDGKKIKSEIRGHVNISRDREANIEPALYRSRDQITFSRYERYAT